jgi:hypothetical protein
MRSTISLALAALDCSDLDPPSRQPRRPLPRKSFFRRRATALQRLSRKAIFVIFITAGAAARPYFPSPEAPEHSRLDQWNAETTMTSFGIDYRDPAGALAHVKPADIQSFQGGKSFVVEYLGGADGQGNAGLTASDAFALESQGLSIASVYENRPAGQPGMSDTDPQGHYTSAWVDYLSQPGQGATDAQNAINGAIAAGQLTGAIYFAMDFDPAKSTDPTTHQNRVSETAALNLIDKYFQDVSASINNYNQLHGTSYQVGVYGAGDTLAKVASDPLVMAGGSHAYTWLAGATGWAGSSTFATSDLKQYDNDQFQLDGRKMDLDQSSTLDFGAWGSSSDKTLLPAVSTYEKMYGVSPSSTELTHLVQFDSAQYLYGHNIGVQDPLVYVYQTLGQALAEGSDTGSTAFKSSWGPAAIASDATFAAQAYVNVFGSQGSAAQIQVFVNQINYFKSIYTASGDFGADSGRIDLLARGAVYGQMLGVENESNPATTHSMHAVAGSSADAAQPVIGLHSTPDLGHTFI